MTWFFLLITALTLFDAVVFVLVIVWGLRTRKSGEPIPKERFRLLVILVVINLIIVLASRLLVWIPELRNWLLPRIEGHQPSWRLIPTLWLFDHRMLWYQICKILGLIGIWTMRKEKND